MKKLYLLIIVVLILQLSAFAQSPIISVDPDSLSEDLLSGKSTTRVLTINNSGGSNLNFEMYTEYVWSTSISTDIKTYDDLFINDSNNLSESTSSNVFNYNRYSNNYTPIRGLITPDDIEPYDLEKSLTVGLNILLITSGSNPDEIRNLLLSFPDIETVDVFDAYYITPSLNELLNYHSVILMNNLHFGDPRTLGNVLADYVDAGGGLILTIATFAEEWAVRGRLLNEEYLPFNLGFGPMGNASLGTYNKNHPIMRGVTNAFGDLLVDVTIADGADLVAEWNNGMPFVATKGSKVAALNIFVILSGYWVGDIPLILNNAVLWTTGGGGWLTAEPSAGTVPAGTFLEVTMTFDASGLSGGGYDANISISSNDPISPEVSVPAHLNVTDAPSISVNTDSLNFGEVYLGVTDSLELEVTNNGSQDLLIFSALTQPNEYSVYPTFAGIDPGENEMFTVTFSPQQAGNYPGTLTFNSNDPLFGSYVETLNGLGIEPPVILINPDSIYIEVLPGHTRIKQLTISNSGASNLYFNMSAIGGNTLNYALQFDGIDDHVYLGFFDGYSDSVTIEAWINTSGSYDWGNIICGSCEDIILGIENNRLNFAAQCGYPIEHTIWSNTLLNDNKWHHVLGKYDGSEISVYIDGFREDFDSANGIFTPSQKSIGSIGSGWDEYFTGIIDELRFWNITRTDEEILQYMNTVLKGDEPGLIGYWQFDEASGDTAYDKSNYDNHGFLQNGVNWIQSTAPIAPPWLSPSPDSGVCYPNSSVDISLLFDATELDTGDYYSTLFVRSNDPIQPMVSVPVHMLVSTTAGVDDEYFIPIAFKLYQNYPNPFNPTTTLRYNIPENAHVILKIYNILGEEVVTLISEEKAPGSYTISWDAIDVSSGIYFYNIKAGDFVETKKMILLK